MLFQTGNTPWCVSHIKHRLLFAHHDTQIIWQWNKNYIKLIARPSSKGQMFTQLQCKGHMLVIVQMIITAMVPDCLVLYSYIYYIFFSFKHFIKYQNLVFPKCIQMCSWKNSLHKNLQNLVLVLVFVFTSNKVDQSRYDACGNAYRPALSNVDLDYVASTINNNILQCYL